MVREDGVILGAAADNAWALNALGVDPSKIIHQPLAQYIDVFADVSRSLPSGRLTPTLVTGQLRRYLCLPMLPIMCVRMGCCCLCCPLAM